MVLNSIWRLLRQRFEKKLPLEHPGRDLGQRPCASQELARLDPSIYRIFQQVHVPRLDDCGHTCIHHLVYSRHGIFVIHVQNDGGEIHGHDEDYHWLIGSPGQERHLVNPLVRNAYHSRCLARLLEIPEQLILPLVYFPNPCHFSHDHAPNLLAGSLASCIQSRRQELLTVEQMDRIDAALSQLRQTQGQAVNDNRSAWLTSDKILSMHASRRARIPLLMESIKAGTLPSGSRR